MVYHERGPNKREGRVEWWARRELHPHPLRDWVLNPARLLFRHVPVTHKDTD